MPFADPWARERPSRARAPTPSGAPPMVPQPAGGLHPIPPPTISAVPDRRPAARTLHGGLGRRVPVLLLRALPPRARRARHRAHHRARARRRAGFVDRLDRRGDRGRAARRSAGRTTTSTGVSIEPPGARTSRSPAGRTADRPVVPASAPPRSAPPPCSPSAAAVPLSLAAGVGFAAAHLAAIVCALAYNAGLKARPASVLPYTVAFGLLARRGHARPAPSPTGRRCWAVAAAALVGAGRPLHAGPARHPGRPVARGEGAASGDRAASLRRRRGAPPPGGQPPRRPSRRRRRRRPGSGRSTLAWRPALAAAIVVAAAGGPAPAGVQADPRGGGSGLCSPSWPAAGRLWTRPARLLSR